MAKRWFIKTKGGERGPFTPQVLQRLVNEGRVKPQMPIRREDKSSWVHAGKFDTLFPPEKQGSEPVSAETVNLPRKIEDSHSVFRNHS